MAQYKVPQDVEADDKLIGPFSFRQFVYLLIAAGLIALAVAFFQIFPLLALIPVPFVLLLAALALPLKKDQPMETYLAAIVSYYLKPRTRLWTPGQKDTAITITAPKITEEETRTRNITGEEATHRLSFLADIVDTQGYAIKGAGPQKMNEELVAEAMATTDIFETNHFVDLESTIAKDENERHEKVMQEMREVIKEEGAKPKEEVEESKVKDAVEPMRELPEQKMEGETVEPKEEITEPMEEVKESKEEVMESNEGSVEGLAEPEDWRLGMTDGEPDFASDVVVQPNSEVTMEEREKTNIAKKPVQKKETIKAKPSIIELANNPDYSIATISKEANRLKERDEDEVFISLH